MKHKKYKLDKERREARAFKFDLKKQKPHGSHQLELLPYRESKNVLSQPDEK